MRNIETIDEWTASKRMKSLPLSVDAIPATPLCPLYPPTERKLSTLTFITSTTRTWRQTPQSARHLLKTSPLMLCIIQIYESLAWNGKRRLRARPAACKLKLKKSGARVWAMKGMLKGC